MRIERVVVWFSAGVTSALAAKMAVNKYTGVFPVHLVMCDTGSEDSDNLRFAHEVSEWVGLPLEIIRNEKFEDTIAVYRSSGFIKSVHGAKCTYELKKIPRRRYENLATDLQVFGYDADEVARSQRFNKNNPEVNTWFPLIEGGISKVDARRELAAAGIREPITYSLGFKNANCLSTGCVKGGMGYWNHIRKVRPEVFWSMAKVEREIGHTICYGEKKDDDGRRIKVPIYLDELSVDRGDYSAEPDFQCGLFCGQDGEETG